MKKGNLTPFETWARHVTRLDEILASQFEQALKSPNAKPVRDGGYFDISFSINVIPKYLQSLFIERTMCKIMSVGSISVIIGKNIRYYYYRRMKLDGNTVSAELLKN